MSNEPPNKHSQAHRIWRRDQAKKLDFSESPTLVHKDEEVVIPTDEPTGPDDVAVEPGEFGDGEVE